MGEREEGEKCKCKNAKIFDRNDRNAKLRISQEQRELFG